MPLLRPKEAIASPYIDAICVGEGDNASVELAAQLLAGRQPAQIPNLWIKQPGTRVIEKNAATPFCPTWMACRLSIGSYGGPGFRNLKGILRC